MIYKKEISDWWNDAYLSIAFFHCGAHFTKLLHESHLAKQLSEGPELHYVSQTSVRLVMQHFLLKFPTFIFDIINDFIFLGCFFFIFFMWSNPCLEEVQDYSIFSCFQAFQKSAKVFFFFFFFSFVKCIVLMSCFCCK